MKEPSKKDKLTLIPEADVFVDTFAEISGVSGYKAHDTFYVNISFLRYFWDSYVTKDGKPASSNLSLKKVASITMTKQSAKDLHEVLSEFIKEQEEEEKKSDNITKD